MNLCAKVVFKHPEKQKAYHDSGKLLEIAVSRAYDHLTLENAHNPFDDTYSHGYGVDNIISTAKGNIELECKNLNGKYQLSKAWIIEEVLNRYGYKPFLKLLVCSFLYVSDKLRRWIETLNHIRIITLGYQVTKYNLNKTIHNLIKKLYFVKVKYAKYVNPKPKNQQVKLSTFDKALVYNGSIIDVCFNGIFGIFNKPIDTKVIIDINT